MATFNKVFGVLLFLGVIGVSQVNADDMSYYVLTQAAYSWNADMDAAVKAEFGDNARVADWIDLESSFAGLIGAFCDSVGLLAYRSSAWVYCGGAAFYSSDRHYFVERHNGVVPGGWLVHDHIDNYTLSLGSWSNARPILVHLSYSISVDMTTWGRIKALYAE